MKRVLRSFDDLTGILYIPAGLMSGIIGYNFYLKNGELQYFYLLVSLVMVLSGLNYWVKRIFFKGDTDEN